MKRRKGRLYKTNRERNKDFVDAYKIATRCKDCNKNYPPMVMEFDHVSDDKFMSVSVLVGNGYPVDVIREEMNKCELVCANCHRIRTYYRSL